MKSEALAPIIQIEKANSATISTMAVGSAALDGKLGMRVLSVRASPSTIRVRKIASANGSRMWRSAQRAKPVMIVAITITPPLTEPSRLAIPEAVLPTSIHPPLSLQS